MFCHNKDNNLKKAPDIFDSSGGNYDDKLGWFVLFKGDRLEEALAQISTRKWKGKRRLCPCCTRKRQVEM